jgi:spore photoproduct lyase
MGQLARHGWSIGLRFDPLIYGEAWAEQYEALFDSVFKAVPIERIHSVSYGPLRFPKKMFKDIVQLYPEERLFAGPLGLVGGMTAYPEELEAEMAEFCRGKLSASLDDTVFFQCTPEIR